MSQSEIDLELIASLNSEDPDFELVLGYIESGADINVQNNSGTTALNFAVELAEKGAAFTLIDLGANLDIADMYGSTPLIGSICNSFNSSIFEKLIANKADVNLTDDFGSNPLMEAAYQGNFEALKILINYTSDIDAQNNHGRTALSLSTSEGHYECIEALVKVGVNLDLTSENGESALHFASANNDGNVVKMILDAGIDVSIKDKWGNTALSVAQSNHNQTATDLIETYIAQKEMASSGDREESISLIIGR